MTQADGNFLVEGKPFYITGANNHYLQFAPKAEVDRVLKDAAAMKLNTIRVWGFLDIGSLDKTMATSWSSYGPNAYDLNTRGVYFQAWDPSKGKPVYNDGANGLQRLDYLVFKAGQLGIKLIIVLANNWQHMGGVPQYMTWFYLEHPYDFYINDQAKQAYKDWVSHVVTRQNILTQTAYCDDPAIMAWELINEPHCDNVTTKVLTNWVTEMSSYIKQLDPHHLVGLGDEGFFDRKEGVGPAYNGSSGVDFEANLKIPAIDFGTYHLYPDWWKMTPEWGVQYIKDHIVVGKAIGKPVILEEFGWQNDSSKEKVYGMWLSAIYQENGAGWIFWRLVSSAENGTRPVDSDHFDIYYPGSVATSFTKWAQLFSAKETASDGGTIPEDLVSTAPESGAPAVDDVRVVLMSENIPRENVIDDFENYDGSNYALNSMYKRNKDGNNVKVSLDTENRNDGKFGLKYEYTLTEPGFCGIVKQKLRNTKWLGATGIQFWLKPDGSDNYFTIQIQETNGEAWEYGFKLGGNKEAKMVQMPFENFGKPGWCKVGDNKLNLRSISTVSIYMGKGNGDSTGVVYIDSIALTGDLGVKK